MLTIIRRPETFIRPLDVLDEAERLFEGWMPLWERTPSTGYIPVDIYEHKGELVVRAELPGFKREDIDLRFEEDMLTIRADKKGEATEEVTYHLKELGYGSYLRSIMLPFPVDGDKFSATFENGVLEVRVPRAEEPKGKHIEIKG